MGEELTTRPMLEALLEGQRHIVSQLTDLRTGYDTLSAQQSALAAKVEVIATKQDALAAKQDELAAKQDDLAARQEKLEIRVVELACEVRDGLYDTKCAIEVFNDRVLTFQTTMRRMEQRFHDEVLLRNR